MGERAARFTAGFRVDLDAKASVRGTRSGELIARCIVETGTSSYYTALAEAAAEPVLKEICRRIAADELRHYKLFYDHLKRYLAAESGSASGAASRSPPGGWRSPRMTSSPTPITPPTSSAAPYDRRRCSSAYARRAYSVYRRHHVERGMAMILKAVGLKPNGRLNPVLSRLAWRFMRYRAAQLDARGGLKLSPAARETPRPRRYRAGA